ncbi:MAG: DUF4097 family beta strand repeat-containing protein [Thermoanaerobaculia bacterium]|nr:DUF4097 family beta strand repeat-containing protein [Thermoanaerobaculia bacterium]
MMRSAPKTSRRASLGLAFCLALLAPALPAGAETLHEEFDEVFRLAPGGEVSVRNTNGSLEFTSWERAEVRVEATKVVKTMGRSRASEAMEALRIEVDHDGDSLHIRTVYPESRSGWLFGRKVEAKVSYRVTVPREVSLHAHTINGNVSVEAVSGTIDARTTNGQIRIAEAAGKANASTTNGNIRAELRKVDRASDCVFRTTNGGITLWVSEDVGAEVAARTTHGSINSDFPTLVRGGSDSWRRNRLEGEINGGGTNLTLETVNGSIQLRRLAAAESPEADDDRDDDSNGAD